MRIWRHFTRSTWGEIRVKWKTKEEVNYPTPLLTSRWFQTKYRKPKMAMMTKQTKSTRKYFSGLGIGFWLLSNWCSWSFSHWIWTKVALLIVSSVANWTFTASARLHFGDEDDDNAEVSFFFSTCTSKTTDLIVSSVSISSNFRKPIHGSLRDSFSDFECTGMWHTISDSPSHKEIIPVLSEIIQFHPSK